MKFALVRLRRRMAQGIAAFVPIMVTILVLRIAFTATAGILLPFIDPAVGDWPWFLRALLSLGVLLVGIYLLGEITARAVGRRLLALGETILLRLPMVKVIYRSAKHVVHAFQRPAGQAFKSVVFMEFPRRGVHALGFVTSTVTRTDGTIWKSVFIPTTPNPTTGFLQLVPEGDLLETEMTVEEAIQMVMSLGGVPPVSLGGPA